MSNPSSSNFNYVKAFTLVGRVVMLFLGTIMITVIYPLIGENNSVAWNMAIWDMVHDLQKELDELNG